MPLTARVGASNGRFLVEYRSEGTQRNHNAGCDAHLQR